MKGGAAVNDNDMEEKRLRHNAQLKVAHELLSTALEAALNCFPEDEASQARGELAHYCIGYLGVSFGLTSS